MARYIAKRLLQAIPAFLIITVIVFLLSNAALAAVAGNILTAAGKFVNGKATVVGTALAFSHAGFKLQIYNVIKGKHGSFVAFRKPLPGNKGGAKGAHDACNVRTDRLASGNFFKAAQNGIIVKGSALYHNVPAQGRSVGNLNYLKQRIFND